MKSQLHLATVEIGHLVDMKMTLKFELSYVGNTTQRLHFFFSQVLELPSTLAGQWLEFIAPLVGGSWGT